ncbi:hypothetical protein ALMP_01300 [Streptomyces sp. A012304]|nr:hypothetical protein ALMP_01300 [Streptomyces sp. A012304]
MPVGQTAAELEAADHAGCGAEEDKRELARAKLCRVLDRRHPRTPDRHDETKHAEDTEQQSAVARRRCVGRGRSDSGHRATPGAGREVANEGR